MTAGPDEVFVAGRELVAGTVKGEAASPPHLLKIEMAEPFQGGYRVQFTGIADRNEADRWRNRYVLAPRAELPEPADDEIYLHDLVGLAVVLADGAPVGRVEAYYELPHDILIEVSRAQAGSVMIPYGFVTEVDVDGGRLVVAPPEGLL